MKKIIFLLSVLLSSAVFADQLTIENKSQDFIKIEYQLIWPEPDLESTPVIYDHKDSIISDFIPPLTVTKIEVPNYDELTMKTYIIGRVMVYNADGTEKFSKTFWPTDNGSWQRTYCYANYRSIASKQDGELHQGISLTIYDKTHDILCSTIELAH